jgi:replicative DNA helicase
MKKESRKLQLNRETLITMQNDDLDLVYGGATPSTIIPVSAASARASSAACLRAASELAKHTARSVATVASAIGSAVSAVFGSRFCGPTQPQPQPQGGGPAPGGEG